VRWVRLRPRQGRSSPRRRDVRDADPVTAPGAQSRALAEAEAEEARRSRRASSIRPVAVAADQLERLRTGGLAELDPDVAALIGREVERQRSQIELIASENFTWPSVLEA